MATKLPDEIPHVEDSPAWNTSAGWARDWLIQPGDPVVEGAKVITLDEAITVVLTVGERMRKCRGCQSSATEIRLLSYEYREGSTHAFCSESCMDCPAESTYYMPAVLWACVEAMRAWEGVRTATAIFSSETSFQSDLDALDIPPDPS